jgi:hypothetical protein
MADAMLWLSFLNDSSLAAGDSRWRILTGTKVKEREK